MAVSMSHRPLSSRLTGAGVMLPVTISQSSKGNFHGKMQHCTEHGRRHALHYHCNNKRSHSIPCIVDESYAQEREELCLNHGRQSEQMSDHCETA